MLKCFFRNRYNYFQDFSQEHDLVFCNDICSVAEVLDTDIVQTRGVYLLTLPNLA